MNEVVVVVEDPVCPTIANFEPKLSIIQEERKNSGRKIMEESYKADKKDYTEDF